MTLTHFMRLLEQSWARFVVQRALHIVPAPKSQPITESEVMIITHFLLSRVPQKCFNSVRGPTHQIQH